MMRLEDQDETEAIHSRIKKTITEWAALEKGEHELQAYEHFLFAIGSAHRFVQEAGEMMSLPARFDRLIREAQRFRHLFGYTCLRECRDAEIASGIEALLREPASVAQPEALESWLERAQFLYRKYQEWYRREHEHHWKIIDAHPIWSYQAPGVSRSKHLSLGSQAAEIEALQSQARAQRCAAVGNLEFQPLCRCGFDGRESPMLERLRQFDGVSNNLEQELALFFQQDRVRTRVQEWVDQGLEVNSRTLSYLEGKAGYPEVENLALFDQHLSGLELVRAVDGETLLDFLGERSWERSALLKALDQFLQRLGPRIMIRRDARSPRGSLAAWCCEQALRNGVSMPDGLTPEELKLAAGLIEPHWVGAESLRRLEAMGLSEDAMFRILELLLGGLVTPPQAAPTSGAVAAALAMLHPRLPQTADELARLVTLLYEQNDRMLRLRPQAWLSLLNDLAEAKLEPPPPALTDLLRERSDAQWLVIDCLGVPILNTVTKMLRDCLNLWEVRSIEFTLTSPESTTDAFYRTLAEGGVAHSFEKINAVDERIHARQESLPDLARVARAELEIALKNMMKKLDHAKPLLIFGDHGFRLALDGRGFTHGGRSTLERLVPVLYLSPRS